MPDLTGAQVTIESLMDDRCVIRRDIDGVVGGAVDPVTGARVADETGDIWEGPCIIRHLVQSTTTPEERGAFQSYEQPYLIKTPFSAPGFQAGDKIVVTASRRNPDLVNKEFNIRVPSYGTFRVSRAALAELDVRFTTYSEV